MMVCVTYGLMLGSLIGILVGAELTRASGPGLNSGGGVFRGGFEGSCPRVKVLPCDVVHGGVPR